MWHVLVAHMETLIHTSQKRITCDTCISHVDILILENQKIKLLKRKKKGHIPLHLQLLQLAMFWIVSKKKNNLMKICLRNIITFSQF